MIRATVILVALTVAAETGAQAGRQAPAAGELRLSPCAPEIATPPAECGTYTVWENRAARKGRTIDLNVVLLKATGPSRRPDPLVYLSGGPGTAATSRARALTGSPLRGARDILLVDQRGTGRSNGLFCGPEPTAPASAFMATIDPARAQKCAKDLSSRADLRHYLTPYAMDDLDDLRAALRYTKLNLHGESYGTRAALVYLRQHGEHVRSVTLQGSVAMSHPMPAGFARAAEDALDGVIRDCAADTACAKAFPDLLRDYRRALSAIEAGSREYAIRDPRNGSTVTVKLTARDFAEALRAMLYTAAAARQIPLFLHQAATTGDYRPFAEFQLQRNVGLTQRVAEGMYFAVSCTEDVARTNTAAAYAAGRGTFLADHRARAHIEGCRGWPRGVLPARFGQEVASDVPVLIITGQYDPATPPRDARSAASRLRHARVVIVPHGGHSAGGLTGAACVPRLVAGFLETADPNGLDTGCLAGMHRPPFALSGRTQAKPIVVREDPRVDGKRIGARGAACGWRSVGARQRWRRSCSRRPVAKRNAGGSRPRSARKTSTHRGLSCPKERCGCGPSTSTRWRRASGRGVRCAGRRSLRVAKEGEISFCAYNTGIGWRNIIEKMHMTATLTKWYEEHGRHEIFAGGKKVGLASTDYSLGWIRKRSRKASGRAKPRERR